MAARADYFGSANGQYPSRRICLCGRCNIRGIESHDPILREFDFLQNQDYFSFNCEEIYQLIQAIFTVELDLFLTSIQEFLRMVVRELTSFPDQAIYNGIGQYLTIYHPENLDNPMNILRELIYVKLQLAQQNRLRQPVPPISEEKNNSSDEDIPELISPGPAAAAAAIPLNNFFQMIQQIQQIYQQDLDQPLELYGSFLNQKVLRTLSKEELAAKNPLLQFSKVEERIKKKNNYACAICQEDFVDKDADSDCDPVPVPTSTSDPSVRQLICEHLFHTECVDEWLCKHDFHCPTCRAPCGNHKCDV